MNLGRIRTIAKEDFRGKDVPEWLDQLLDPLNTFIEQVGLALQGRLTFEDNFFSKVLTLKLTHNTALEINPLQGGTARATRVLGVLALSAGGDGVDSLAWDQLSNGNVEITIKFTSGSGEQSCKLLLLYQ